MKTKLRIGVLGPHNGSTEERSLGFEIGTEIAFALRLGVPVVGLQTWSVVQNGTTDPGIHVANTPKEAVAMALKLAARVV